MPFTKTTWTDDVTYLSAENMNDIENTLDGNRLAPTAGGTGTAITVTAYQFTLTDGCVVSFVASANNSGAATTINVNGLGAKSAYKANTANAPTIVSGRMYVFWYSTGGTCFFLRAAATGNATAAHVLTPDTFSNDDNTDVVGTMPNNAGDVASVSAHMDAGTVLHVVPAEGYADGVNDATTVNLATVDADHTAKNIIDLVTDLGVVGTDTSMSSSGGGGKTAQITFYSNAGPQTTTSATYEEVLAMAVKHHGTFLIEWTLTYAGSATVYAKIYINGVVYGDEKSDGVGGTACQQVVTAKTGDEVQIYAHSDGVDIASISGTTSKAYGTSWTTA